MSLFIFQDLRIFLGVPLLSRPPYSRSHLFIHYHLLRGGYRAIHSHVSGGSPVCRLHSTFFIPCEADQCFLRSRDGSSYLKLCSADLYSYAPRGRPPHLSIKLGGSLHGLHSPIRISLLLSRFCLSRSSCSIIISLLLSRFVSRGAAFPMNC